MFAIIETGGKQYKVKEGDILKVEKIPLMPGDGLRFEKVLLIADGESVSVGHPYLEGVFAEGMLIRQGRHKKKIVFRYHSKTRYRKRKGHRQPFTEIKITGIVER